MLIFFGRSWACRKTCWNIRNYVCKSLEWLSVLRNIRQVSFDRVLYDVLSSKSVMHWCRFPCSLVQKEHFSSNFSCTGRAFTYHMYFFTVDRSVHKVVNSTNCNFLRSFVEATDLARVPFSHESSLQ